MSIYMSGQYSDRRDEMTKNAIKVILEWHGIESEEIEGKVYAVDVSVKNGIEYHTLVDVTGFTQKEMRDWLGY